MTSGCYRITLVIESRLIDFLCSFCISVKRMFIKKAKKIKIIEEGSTRIEKCKVHQGSRKAPFFITIVMFFLVVVAGVGLFFKARTVKDLSFSFANAQQAAQKDVFAEPVNNVVCESPEMVFAQKNSIIAVSCPFSVDTTSLGNIVEAEGADSKSEGGVVDYIVESDDTIDSIAKKFKISVNTIMWANDLTSKTVKTGQELTILPVSGVIHLAKEGDTIANIAKKYKADVKEIIAFNDLTGENDLYIGDMLIVPNGKITATTAKPSNQGIPLADAYFIFPTQGRITQGPHGALRVAVDIANSCGTPIVAAAGGTVQRVGWINVGGNRITILHPNGVVTYYGHLTAMAVAPGQTVSAGQIIGYMGRTGLATGCHLHFETRGAKNFLSKYSIGATVGWKK